MVTLGAVLENGLHTLPQCLLGDFVYLSQELIRSAQWCRTSLGRGLCDKLHIADAILGILGVTQYVYLEVTTGKATRNLDRSRQLLYGYHFVLKPCPGDGSLIRVKGNTQLGRYFGKGKFEPYRCIRIGLKLLYTEGKVTRVVVA